jgi:hypothetical protein
MKNYQAAKAAEMSAPKIVEGAADEEGNEEHELIRKRNVGGGDRKIVNS